MRISTNPELQLWAVGKGLGLNRPSRSACSSGEGHVSKEMDANSLILLLPTREVSPVGIVLGFYFCIELTGI